MEWKKLIKEAIETPDYDAKALLFSRVAIISRNKICYDKISIDGNFSKNCQEIAPNTKNTHFSAVVCCKFKGRCV